MMGEMRGRMEGMKEVRRGVINREVDSKNREYSGRMGKENSNKEGRNREKESKWRQRRACEARTHSRCLLS